MRKLIIASTSTIHGSEYLEYLLPTLKTFFSTIDKLLFIPYARPSGITHDEYTKRASNTFKQIGINVYGIHQFKNPQEAIQSAQAIFVGGGNTFVLVNELYEQDLIRVLEEKINAGTLYLGTSA